MPIPFSGLFCLLVLFAFFVGTCLAVQVCASLCGMSLEYGSRHWRKVAIGIFVVGLFGVLATHTRAAEPPQQFGPLGIAPTAREIALGHKLFFEPRLSANGTVSCATCHDPAKGWGDGLELAVGIGGRLGVRHSPTVINAVYSPRQFWDGRTFGNITQSLLPLSNPVEMGQQSEADVVQRLRLIPGYVEAFARTFGVDPQTQSPITGPRLARAIAAFETTLISFDAPIDRRLEGDPAALTPDEEIGFQLVQSAGCFSCHAPPLLTDNLLHNNGMEFAGKFRATDQGLAGTLPANRRTAATVRAFKTPHLRELASTAPYSHAGNFADLDRVLIHYATGGQRFDGRRDPFIDPRVAAIAELRLDDHQRRYMKLFLLRATRGRTLPDVKAPLLP